MKKLIVIIVGGIAFLSLLYSIGLIGFCVYNKPFVNMYGNQRPYIYELAFQHRYTEHDFARLSRGNAICLALFRFPIIIGAELGMIPSDQIPVSPGHCFPIVPAVGSAG